MEIAARAKQKINQPDLRSVALFIVKVFNNIRGSGEVTEYTEDKVVISIYECPYQFDTPEICEAHTTMEKLLIGTLGKNLDYSIPKSIPKGDSYFDHVIVYQPKQN